MSTRDDLSACSDHRARLRRSWHSRRGALDRRLGSQGGDSLKAPSPGQALRQTLFERLLRDVERQGTLGTRERTDTRRRVGRVLDEALASGTVGQLSPSERGRLEAELVSEIDGLGPLDPLFRDPSVSDILVNGPYDIWVDRFGRLERTAVRFDDDAHLRRLLDRTVAADGRRLDEASPWADVRLADGSRLNAVIPPLSRGGAMLSIRRARAAEWRLEQLYAGGALSEPMGRFLGAVVEGGLNVIVSGGAASGKTTLLNVLSRFVPPGERLITIEETAELRLDHPHVVSLEAQAANVEGHGEVTLRSLVRNALRMRADRLIVGEVRGPEVFDMLQAMNTGHYGSLSTVHANSPEDCLRRLESLVLMGGFELPSRVIREMLAAALDVVVHVARFSDGSRRVTSIQEVALDGDRLATRELFCFEADSRADSGAAAGRHVQTGVRPHLLSRLDRGAEVWREERVLPGALLRAAPLTSPGGSQDE